MNSYAPPKQLVRLHSAVILLAIFCAIATSVRAQEKAANQEYQVKAAFLYNFAKFVSWPDSKFSNSNAPFIIGVFGKDPFGNALRESIVGRKIDGHPIEIRNIRTVNEVKDVHVLFVAGTENARAPGLHAALLQGNVLGVGESEDFLSHGGVIRFIIERERIRFDINISSAIAAGLKISSQLQKLARSIKKN